MCCEVLLVAMFLKTNILLEIKIIVLKEKTHLIQFSFISFSRFVLVTQAKCDDAFDIRHYETLVQ